MTDDAGPTQHDSHFQRWLALVNLSPEERTARLFDMWWRSVSDRVAKSRKREDGQGTDEAEPTKERLRMAGDASERVTMTMKVGDREEITSNLRMLDGSVLDMLMSRRSITLDHYSAGAQLYEDWFISRIGIVSAVDPSRDVVQGGKVDFAADRILIAAADFAEAILAVGKVHSNVLINVVLLDEDLATYARRSHPIKDDKDARYAGIVTLRNALTELDHYYHGKRSRQDGSSHMDDYRPVIQPAS